MTRETTHRPYANQPHDPAAAESPAGWYQRPEDDSGTAWEWDGTRWTGAHMRPLESWRDDDGDARDTP